MHQLLVLFRIDGIPKPYRAIRHKRWYSVLQSDTQNPGAFRGLPQSLQGRVGMTDIKARTVSFQIFSVHYSLLFWLPALAQADWSPASRGGSPSSTPIQSIWDLWWTNRQCDRFFSTNHGFYPVSIAPPNIYTLSFITGAVQAWPLTVSLTTTNKLSYICIRTAQ
jgi:hypothetical protein